MKTVRHAVMMTVVAGGLACGVETGDSASTSPASPSASPVELMPLSFTPGCYVEATPSLGSLAVSDLVSQNTQMAQMQASFDAQYLGLLTRPILEEPAAAEWRRDGANSRYRASAVAQGERWGVIEAGWVSEAPPGASNQPPMTVSILGTIRYQPAQTSVHLTMSGNSTREVDVVITPRSIRLGTYGRACELGAMVDLVPWEVNGAPVEQALVCRRESGGAPLTTVVCRMAARKAWGAEVDWAGLPVAIFN